MFFLFSCCILFNGDNMSKEEFKIFAKSHPELLNYIKSGEMTWQKFYEIYDIYGEDESAWKTYLTGNKINIASIKDMIKNIDTKSIQEHINNAQKAIGVVQELASKKGVEDVVAKGPLSPRPITKIFED